MPKVAIVTDSNSGITQQQGKDLGISVIPMPFFINNEQFFEDINLTVPEFYEKLRTGADISTSQPTPDTVTGLWDRLLESYDEIVHIPMSSGLSSSCQSAIALAQDYGGKVQVVNNQRISTTQRQSVLDAMELVKRGKSAAQIRQILEEDKFNSTIYIMLDTLYYLKKGGRVTPAAAALGTLLRLKPVLQIQGEKLDAFAKARTTAQGKTIMTNAIQNDIANRFGGISADNRMLLTVVHTENLDAALAYKKELQVLYPDNDIYIDQLSLSVSCHIGPGCLAVTCCKQMKYDEV